MRSDRSDLSPRGKVTHHGEVLVDLASESYRAFSRWMDRELEKLVARWAHVAAPKASRPPRLRFRIAKPK